MPTPRRQRSRAFSWSITGTWLLVILSVVSWRPDSLFTGGLDVVVVAKALIALTALGCALLIHHRSTAHARVGVRSAILLIIVVGLSVLGALASGDVMPSLVLALRILILAATVYVLASCAAPLRVLNALFIAMGIFTIVGAVSGIPSFLTEGRLPSGLPAMKPNDLAALAAPPLLALAIDAARRGLTTSKAALLLVFFVILLATGSRTTLVVVMLAIAVGVLLAWPVPHSTGIALIILAPVSYALVAFTDVVYAVLIRGQDSDQLITFSSRTIAWEAVFSIPLDSWSKWIGVGLAVKTVEVDQRWRDVQALDSSWISILAQVGIVGLIAVSLWVLLTIADGFRNSDLRVLAVPLLVFLLLRSALENGLIESSIIFTLFLLTSLVVEPGYRFPFVHKKAVRHALATAQPPPQPPPATLTTTRSR